MKLDELQQVDRLESWVFQITRNAIVDHLRSDPKSNSAQQVQELAEPLEDETGNLNQEIAGWVAVLVAFLPDDQRRALTMYEFEGLTQKVIATRESITVSGAKSRIQRGRRNLAKILTDCCQFELDRRGNVIDVKANASGPVFQLLSRRILSLRF